MEALVKREVKTWFQSHAVGIGNTVLLAMSLAEEMASTNNSITGPDKLRLALDACKNIANEAFNQEVITANQHMDLWVAIEKGEEYLVPFIELAIEVSKHPILVQMKDAVKHKCCGVPRRRPRARASLV